MSDDAVIIWWNWGCWLFGFRFSRTELGVCVGPLSISILLNRLFNRA